MTMLVSKQQCPQRLQQSQRRYSSSKEFHPRLTRRVLAAAAVIIISLLNSHYSPSSNNNQYSNMILFPRPSSFSFERRGIGVGFVIGVGAMPTASPTAQRRRRELTAEDDIAFRWLEGREGRLNEFVFRSEIHAIPGNGGNANDTNSSSGSSEATSTFPSYYYRYDDFITALRLVSNNGTKLTKLDKHVFYIGQHDIAEDEFQVNEYLLAPNDKDDDATDDDATYDDDEIIGRGRRRNRILQTIDEKQKQQQQSSNGNDRLEYGLVNIAAFLGHAMTTSIIYDVCDEFHWETSNDYNRNTTTTATTTTTTSSTATNDSSTTATTSTTNAMGDRYAISNSCGQNYQNYQDFHCSSSSTTAADDESYMECKVNPNMIIQASTSLTYTNAPPPLSCMPRSTMDVPYTGYYDVDEGRVMTDYPYKNTYGRTDIEGCCYWGRGALMVRGICTLGKLNYYLGMGGLAGGGGNTTTTTTTTTANTPRYPTTDFCANPESICTGPQSREMRWVTSFFDWTDRVQSYDDSDGSGWNYMNELKKFVLGGMIDDSFIHATSAILTKGCHSPPCSSSNSASANVGEGNNGGFGTGSNIHLAEERVTNFNIALVALEAGRGELALLRGLIQYFTDREDIMATQILLSQTPQGKLYPSYRYQLSDFLSALTYISEQGVGGRKFYMGESNIHQGVRYGVVNAVLFLAQAYKESIQYDACDENNWELVNDLYPLSNACGQLGMSYQDMVCREDEAYMECSVQADMEQVAITNAGWFQAPAPFKCGPKSKYPITGYWDYDMGRENNADAYANARGRVDIEGCCFWGRGVLQTRGTCMYGKLNYWLGKRAADEGRDALYPKIDFCSFPQGVCSSSETYGGQLQWMVGFFEWSDRIQTYDVDGWNYIEKLKEFTDGGYKDFSFVDSVSGILNIGCHNPPCRGFNDVATDPHNMRDRNDIFQRFLNQLQVERTFRPPPKPTPMPSPAPTEGEEPITNVPTELEPPTESPTSSAMPTGLMGRPPADAIDAIFSKIEEVMQSISITSGNVTNRFAETVFQSEHPSGALWPSYLYTWQGFHLSLKKMTSGEGPGEKNFFYIGDGISENSLEYGIVNVAAFLAQGVVRSIYNDTCDENSYDMVDFRYPLSNSCGQQGLSYQDEICEKDEDIGLECEVDEDMEINGVTNARWLGAPPPMACGNRQVGYWDHTTGLEENDIPFMNKGGRNDTQGCCWWGRGVLQVRGVCSYGKLNYWLGAKATTEKRKSLYPDIDFCKNPGAICSDKRSPELRWITGMFHWVQTVQRNSGDFQYFQTLKEFVDGGNYSDEIFMNMVNTMLGGSVEDRSRRSDTFYNILRAFNLIKVEGDFTGTPTFCGVDLNDAGIKCRPCDTNLNCSGAEFCYANVTTCIATINDDTSAESTNIIAVPVDDDLNSAIADDSTNVTDVPIDDDNSTLYGDAPTVDDKMTNNSTANITTAVTTNTSSTNAAGTESLVPMSLPISSSTSFCGVTWGDALTKCAKRCPSGTDTECDSTEYCFIDITICSSKEIGLDQNQKEANEHNN